LILVIKLNNCF